jgi:hypothetical protein
MPRVRTAAAAAATVMIAAGLPLLTPSAASAATGVLPWDFNGDGRADLAVGAPGADVGGDVDAGAVHVFMANASGTYDESTEWTADTAGVYGASEGPAGSSLHGDQFGYALTSDDFNGDTFADLAIAGNGEDIGSIRDAGIVTILWGSGSGLTAANSMELQFDVNGVIHPNTFAGDALASGDMDGDGKAELAVGGPGQELVKVYQGAAKANFGTTFTNLSEYSLPGTKRFGDLFGESLAMGDFDDDGNADLIIGAPYDIEDRGYSLGASVVVYGGGTNGPDVSRAARWSPDTADVAAGAHTFTVNDLPDSFGRTLGVGDYNNDGFDDVAIGIPGSKVGKVEDAGAVEVMLGSASGLTATGDYLLTADSSGIAGPTGAGDLFGASLDGGRVNGKGDLLAVGSAKEVVWALPGAKGAGSTTYSQDTAGVYSSREAGDAFGAFVRFIDSEGGSQSQSLAIGSPGESFSAGPTSAGLLFVLPPGSNYPTGTDSQYFYEGANGVAGVQHSGDAFGWLGDSH